MAVIKKDTKFNLKTLQSFLPEIMGSEEFSAADVQKKLPEIFKKYSASQNDPTKLPEDTSILSALRDADALASYLGGRSKSTEDLALNATKVFTQKEGENFVPPVEVVKTPALVKPAEPVKPAETPLPSPTRPSVITRKAGGLTEEEKGKGYTTAAGDGMELVGLRSGTKIYAPVSEVYGAPTQVGTKVSTTGTETPIMQTAAEQRAGYQTQQRESMGLNVPVSARDAIRQVREIQAGGSILPSATDIATDKAAKEKLATDAAQRESVLTGQEALNQYDANKAAYEAGSETATKPLWSDRIAALQQAGITSEQDTANTLKRYGRLFK